MPENTDFETPAFKRDPPFIGHLPSIRIPALSPQRLLIMFQHSLFMLTLLFMLILSIYM